MCRTFKSTLVGFVGFGVMVAPVFAQDVPLHEADSGTTFAKEVSVSVKAFELPTDGTGTKFDDAEDDKLFEFFQPAETEIKVSDLGGGDAKALIAKMQSITRVVFKIEKRAGATIADLSDEKPFWCGLIYDKGLVTVKSIDESVGSKAFYAEDDAAKKIADAFLKHFSDDQTGVEVTHDANMVVIDVVDAAASDIIRGVSFGSGKFKISVSIFTEKSFRDGVGKYKFDPDKVVTGGPLMPPINWPKETDDASTDPFEDGN